MIVDYHRSVLVLLAWQWRALVTYAVIASVMVGTEIFTAWNWLAIPGVPLTVLGGAIGIFVSFRTNSCYDRWWEGRRLLGQLVNVSRHFATQTMCYVDGASAPLRAVQEALVKRHVGYVHMLRCQLRGHEPARDEAVVRYVDAAELEASADEPNPCHWLLHRQTRAIVALRSTDAIDGWRLQLFDRSIAVLLDVQGGCERIKKTPFPQSYGFLATKLIAVYAALLPLGMVDAAGWLAVPITVLVCLAFRLIDEVGDALEDPFSLQPLALPLSAITTAIEMELGRRLGERRLPDAPAPNEEGVLM
ncbi:MAG TPA: bestrophin family protein [Nannocystaceae bacterium]|nr:bestrophin family protein [Nannocystaceae bacterium]